MSNYLSPNRQSQPRTANPIHSGERRGDVSVPAVRSQALRVVASGKPALPCLALPCRLAGGRQAVGRGSRQQADPPTGGQVASGHDPRAEGILNNLEDWRDYRLLNEMNGASCARRQWSQLRRYPGEAQAFVDRVFSNQKRAAERLARPGPGPIRGKKNPSEPDPASAQAESAIRQTSTARRREVVRLAVARYRAKAKGVSHA